MNTLYYGDNLKVMRDQVTPKGSKAFKIAAKSEDTSPKQ
jgi:hypothetical protein